MFTLEDIKAAHSKVKSGADFPAYIQDLIALGVASYDSYVFDGHTDYFSSEGITISSPAKYAELEIKSSDAEQFISDLRAHQQGKTDYPTFCNDCAKSGVEKWTVNMDAMTCIYYDQSGSELLVENIPYPVNN